MSSSSASTTIRATRRRSGCSSTGCWPRGLRKDAFHHDDWAKDLAPSTGLRKWYSHDASQFAEFRDRYLTELDGPDARAALARVDALADGRSIVLLTATRDVEHSGAAVLAERMRGAR